jgi:RNA ligase
MRYQLNILEDYIDRGLVMKQTHPNLPLSIYNYTRTCQYDSMWDDVTINCRGLILDTEGNVIAKPFPKFFNYEELVGNKFKHSEIPNEYFDVYEKMDGSLGICFNYNGEWHMATRGSFVSEQAVKGKEMLDKLNTKNGLVTGYTYLFEIIYPENRIVVDYGGAERLVVLGCYNNETGNEVSIDEMVNEGFEVVTKYNTFGEGFDVLKKEISKSKEGYVIRFKSGMRMKIKGDEYVRLHKILTNFSSKDIWELLKDGGSLDEFLDRVPDEFDKWVKEQVSHMKYGFYQYSEYCGKIHDYFRYGKYNDREPEPTKKEFVEHLDRCGTNSVLKPILFAMWDKKPYDHIIWKLLKPKYEKPFKKDIDN